MIPAGSFARIAALGLVALVASGFLAARTSSAAEQTESLVLDPIVNTVAAGLVSPVAPDQLGRLQEALLRYRGIESRGGWGSVPTDVVMGPGNSYDCRRIEILERRLVAEGYLRRISVRRPPPSPEGTPPPASPPPSRNEPLPIGGHCPYGPELTDALRNFQADRKILGYGQLGSQTMAELNRPVGEVVDILEQDVRRWQARASQPSGSYLLVSIPFFELNVFENDREVSRMPTIVGQKSWQTPAFSDQVESVVLNPDWGIPDSIAKNEIWPAARRDKNYFRWQGIVDTGSGLRQKPGPRNPLGRVKFSMPNENDVYLHDTSEKRAFNAAMRALSHGCVRLARPRDLAARLLAPDPNWGPERLQKTIASGKTVHIKLLRPMPVHIVYATSRVNEDGRVELRPDVYGKNRSSRN